MKRVIAIAIIICLTSLTGLALTGAAWARMVVDEMGRKVEVPDQPKRIIGLIASLVETIYALGLGDRMVGATTWCDYPEAAKRLPRVGSYTAPNLERIVELAPDLVLATRVGNPSWVVDKLTAAGIPVYVTVSQDPRKMPDSLAKLGLVCGAEKQGKQLARKLRAQYAAVAEKLKGAPLKPTILIIGSRPLISVAKGTLNHELLVMAHAENIAAAAPGPWPRLSLEYVVQNKPQVVILSTMERGQQLEREVKYWRTMPGVGDRPGVRVVSINSDLTDRPGPRLGLGLEALARAVHPERFEPAKTERAK